MPNAGAGTATGGDPLGIWYYPSYHRFHTAHGVLNFYLPKNYTLTLAASYATGTPRTVTIDPSIENYAEYGYYIRTVIDPGMDLHGRHNQQYSDTARYLAEWPVDIRLSPKGTFKNPKKTWEWYFGIENLLGFVSEIKKSEFYSDLGIYNKSSGWTIGKGFL